MSAPLSATLLTQYQQAILRRPLLTKAATCFVGFSLGDILAQAVTYSREAPPMKGDWEAQEFSANAMWTHASEILRAWQPMRTFQMAVFGTMIAAPQMHVFFTWLDRVTFQFAYLSATNIHAILALFFPKTVMPQNAKHPLAIALKVLIDQGFNSPLGTSLYLTWTAACNGHPGTAWDDIQQKLWPTTKMSWMLWPAAQVVNFALVPPAFRVVALNAISIVWTTILSLVGNSPTKHTD